MRLAAGGLWLSHQRLGLAVSFSDRGYGSCLKLCSLVNINEHDIHIIKHESIRTKYTDLS